MMKLVAHRGQRETRPENTLTAIETAIGCGAQAVEFDLQLTADAVPVLCHDRTLARTAGMEVDVTTMEFAALREVGVGEPGRFGDRYADVPPASLAETVSRLEAAPGVEVFAEIKDDSIAAFGIGAVADAVAARLAPLVGRVVVIADNAAMLEDLRKRHGCRIGWIIHGFSRKLLGAAAQLGPEVMVVNRRYLSGRRHDFSADPWAWMVYQTTDPARAKALFAKGIRYVETDDICSMLQRLGAAEGTGSPG